MAGAKPSDERLRTVVLLEAGPETLGQTAGDTSLARRLRSSPARVGRYRIEGLLGAGGMGAVFRGWDPELDRPVALKLIRTRRSSAGDSLRARMIREAQALAALSHANVVNVFEVGTHDEAVFIAMELVEGPTLQSWVSSEDRQWRDVVRMYVQAGRGLLAAHQKGIVHRDFKPDNVIVGEDGRARVLDFGLATVEGSASSMSAEVSGDADRAVEDPLDARLTAVGTVVGTPAYMAPEQHHKRPVTAAADQFGFCVALWGSQPRAPNPATSRVF